jgi:hypothetical protein
LRGGFAHRLEGRKVHGGGNAVAFKDTLHRGFVAHVGAFEHGHLAGERLQAAQHLRRAVGKIVHANHAVTRRQQGQPGVRADVAGRAGEQDVVHQTGRVIAG